MTATQSDLPWATREDDNLVYTYCRPKGATGISYRVQTAGNLISNGWSELGPSDHFKTGETGELEVWQATLPMLPDRSQGFLILEIIKQP